MSGYLADRWHYSCIELWLWLTMMATGGDGRIFSGSNNQTLSADYESGRHKNRESF